LSAFAQGDFWGGSILYNDTASPQLLRAFAELNNAAGFDEYGALMLSFSHVSSLGFIVSRNLEYFRPLPNLSILQSFSSIQPQLFNIMRIFNQTDFTTEFVQMQLKGRR
jgi:hypothetical protein